MTQLAQLILLLSFSQINCHSMDMSKSTKEVFVQKVNDTLNNYIELIKEGDSLKGVFYGVEIDPSLKEPLYYKADLQNLKIEGNNISFSLTSCLYSNRSLYGNRDKSAWVKTEDTLPYTPIPPRTYFGERKGDKLTLRKTHLISNSASDGEVIFVKKK
jgi:hypothetical protein